MIALLYYWNPSLTHMYQELSRKHQRAWASIGMLCPKPQNKKNRKEKKLKPQLIKKGQSYVNTFVLDCMCASSLTLPIPAMLMHLTGFLIQHYT